MADTVYKKIKVAGTVYKRIKNIFNKLWLNTTIRVKTKIYLWGCIDYIYILLLNILLILLLLNILLLSI